jgi:glucokinase
MHAIGIDIGGTATRVGVVSSDAKIVAIERSPTPANAVALCDSIATGVASVLNQSSLSPAQCSRVGLALPGLIDEVSGRVRRCVNLQFLEGRDPIELLPVALRSDALVMSDAEAATWGEYSACDPSPSRFAHLRLGTGVACGVIVDGAMVKLTRPADQHADVLVYDQSADAKLCKCGRRGCLETIASRGAIFQNARAIGIGDSPDELRRAISNGTPRAIELVDSASRVVAVIVDQLAREHGVEVVAIGGGIVAALTELLDGVRRHLSDAAGVRATAALHGDAAGVVGVVGVVGVGKRSLRRS